MRRKMFSEIKNGAGILAVLAVVAVWYIFYYGVYTKESKADPSTYITRTSHTGSHLFAIIEDGDSRPENRPTAKSWGSTYAVGRITVHKDESMEQEILNHTMLEYNLAEGGRGMELSELQKFAGDLLAVDDRTGVVYSIEDFNVVPKYILVDGNGHSKKGFKGEWMTVKDHKLYVGGFGKPWSTPTGEILNYDPMWIKIISPEGSIEHRYWKRNYEALKKAAGISDEGYILHEAVCWSAIHEKWFFLPRRVSNEIYDDKKDEVMGSNMLITADEMFHDIDVSYITVKMPERGFSSFKFLPYSNDQIIVALKTAEVDGKIATYIQAFNLQGKELLPETMIFNNIKFEGIEFL